MASKIQLSAVAMERALEPGTIAYVKCDIAVSGYSLINSYVAAAKPVIVKEAGPLWQFMGDTVNYDGRWVEFRFKLLPYVTEVETGKIIPLSQVGKESPATVTKYYASAGLVKVVVAMAAVAIAGFTAWTVSKVSVAYVAKQEKEQEQEKTKQAIIESDMAEEDKAAALESQTESTLDKAGTLVDKVTVGLVVAVIVAFIVGALD